MLWRFVPACFLFSLLLISISSVAASPPCDVTGGQILSDLFVRPSEHHLRSDVVERRLIPEKKDPAFPFPSAGEFRKRFPFNSQESYGQQTWISYQRQLYQVKGYSPANGRVALSRNILNYQPLNRLKEALPGVEIEAGKIISIEGEKFQVLGVDQFHIQNGEKVVHLAKRVTLSVPLSEIHADLESAVKLEDLKTYLQAMREHAGKSQSVIPFAEESARLVGSAQKDMVYDLGAPAKSPFHQLNEELGIPKDYILEVTEPDESFVRIPLKDYTQEMEKTAKSVEVYDPSMKLVVNYQRLKKWGYAEKPFLNITPIKSNVYHFEIGEGVKAKTIRVTAPTSGNPAQDAIDLEKIRSLVQKIPEPLKNFVEVIRFDPGAAGFGLAAATSNKVGEKLERQVVFYQKDPIVTSVVTDILNRPHAGETFWHELGHHLQAKAANQIPNFDWKLWEDAMVHDRAWVTPYSMILTSEDFPETLARYIRTDAGRLDPKSRKVFKYRFELLDRFFKTL